MTLRQIYHVASDAELALARHVVCAGCTKHALEIGENWQARIWARAARRHLAEYSECIEPF